MNHVEYARSIAQSVKNASLPLKSISTKDKNKVLERVEELLLSQEGEILVANEIDLAEGKKKNLSPALMDRLLLDPKRIRSLANSIREIRNLPDPVGEVLRGITLPNGLELLTKRVPIGVVMTIFESRPNVCVDIAALSFKSGNGCILRGGSEAFHSNSFLTNLFHKAITDSKLVGITPDVVGFVERTEREAMLPFFQLDQWIDIVVPRGGEALIRFVSENSKIPVIKHDKGVTNLFIGKSANPNIVLPVLINSKLARPGVCNALENLIIDRAYPYTQTLLADLKKAGVELLGDTKTLELLPGTRSALTGDYATEFLDNRLSVKIVDGFIEAKEFIQTYSSGHTECILSEDLAEIHRFQRELDSAAIFVNCSTRFHDGGEYGLGAEVGISTGKLHVRGPMGLIHLTTTTTYVTGNGQIRD